MGSVVDFHVCCYDEEHCASCDRSEKGSIVEMHQPEIVIVVIVLSTHDLQNYERNEVVYEEQLKY